MANEKEPDDLHDKIVPGADGSYDEHETEAPFPAEDEEEDVLVGLSDNEIADILDALHHGYDDALVEKLHDLGAADTAELLIKITPDDREQLLTHHGAALDPHTFIELSGDLRTQLLNNLPAKEVAAIISEMESDDALDLMIDLDEDFQKEIIRNLSAKIRITLEQGLSFPEESAGRLMQREFVAIPQFWTVGKTIDYLRAAANDLPEDFFDIFVITPTYRVVGEIPLNRIIRAKRPERLEDLKLEETHPIPADMDQEEVAQLFRRENLTSAPVVDEEDRIIGVITIDDVVDVIDEEAQEDIMKLGGVEDGGLHGALLPTSALRFKWLAVNLLTAVLASWVISFFEGTIQELVALAVLMPIVASMGGNAGTQTLTIAVRALATRELSGTNMWRTIFRETAVTTLNGIAFAIILGILTALWFANPMLGGVIGAAMIINLFCAGFFGACIPVLLDRMGSDPAISSAIFLTTVTDVVGFFAFLGLAALILM